MELDDEAVWLVPPFHIRFLLLRGKGTTLDLGRLSPVDIGISFGNPFFFVANIDCFRLFYLLVDFPTHSFRQCLKQKPPIAGESFRHFLPFDVYLMA